MKAGNVRECKGEEEKRKSKRRENERTGRARNIGNGKKKVRDNKGKRGSE